MELLVNRIRERINEILERIDVEVKAKRDDYSSGDSDHTDHEERTLAHSGICRQFIILDWIFKDLKKRKTSLSEQDIAVLEELKARVEGARLAANATLEDVKAMQVPPPFLKKVQPLNYLELPQSVVREKILEFITCPIDKINVMQVAPFDGEFMKWDEQELKSLAIFQILMNKGFLRKQDQFALMIVSPGLRDLVKMNYENYMLAHQRHERRYMGVILRTPLPMLTLHFPLIKHRDLRRTEFRLNPIPGQIAVVIISFPMPSLRFGFDKQIKWMRKIGQRIWDLKIEVSSNISLPEGFDKMSACLDLTPNLRKLALAVCNAENGEENVELDLDAVVFPKLRSLETLEIWRCKCNRLQTKFLEIYGRKLRHLKIWDVIETEQGTDQSSLCPLLTSLLLNGGLDLIMDQLSAFQNSSLTVIELIVEENSLIAGYPALLCQISQQFGRTLESLSISTCNADGQVGGGVACPRPRHISSTWMTWLDFPKVKHLEIDEFGQEDGFKLLVLFPALETLYFLNDPDPEEARLFGFVEDVDGENQLVSGKWSEMLGSVLWKLLPRLDCYCVEKWERESIDGNVVTRTRNTRMFRKDCLTD